MEKPQRAAQIHAVPVAGADRVLGRIWDDAVNRRPRHQYGADALSRGWWSFAICAVGGVAIGMAMARNKIANWFFGSYRLGRLPMPKIAFLPVVILWLGVYDVSKITSSSSTPSSPVIAATIVGIQAVERELIWSARNMGANQREVLMQVVFPAALPQIPHRINRSRCR